MLISFFGGVWADRYNKKYIIAISDTAIAISTLIVAIFFVVGLDNVWILFSALAIRSFGAGVQTPTVNAIVPKNLAIACNERGIPLVHISTDYVFNGEKNTPLVEDDKVGPKSAYGKTKLAGEEFIKENMEKYYILRTAWLYGYHGNNFVKTMLSLASNHDEVNVVYDQIGSPTFTHDLALAIHELVEYYEFNKEDMSKYGIYHLTNSAECSWYEFTKYFYKLANLNTKVKPVTTEEFPRPAPRPNYSVLSNEKWIKAGFKPLRNYKEAIKDYLAMIL